MSPQLKAILIINILLCATFVFASYMQWQLFTTDNEATFVVSFWNPLSLTITHRQCINGEIAYESGFTIYPNLPFLLFWVSTIANLFFLVKVMRDKEKPK
jgi:hypothetical protein